MIEISKFCKSPQSYEKKCTFANFSAEKLHSSAFLVQECLLMLA